LHVPGGPGVRWDGGVEAGSVVGLHYDPLLAKLIVWGGTGGDGVGRMHRALRELRVEGVETSREFHLRVMEDEEFRRGAIEVQWLERRLASLLGERPSKEERRVAAIAAALIAERDRAGRAGRATGSRKAAAPDSAGPALAGAEPSAWAPLARREALRDS